MVISRGTRGFGGGLDNCTGRSDPTRHRKVVAGGGRTKVMVVTDGVGVTFGALIESAQKAEVHVAESNLAQLRVPRRRGKPRTRPQLLAKFTGSIGKMRFVGQISTASAD